MKQSGATPFRILLGLFRARFFENDTVSPAGGFDIGVYQVLALLVTPGFFIAYLMMPGFLEMSAKPPGPAVDALLRLYRLFFPAFSFAVVGFATVFEWEMLFPDRRDFLVLGPFPVRVRTLFAAKFSALGLFLLLLITAVNGITTVMTPLFSLLIPELRNAGFLRLFAAQIAAAGGASAFAFFAVAGFQGLLINLTTPRTFARISPWIQVCGMSLMILSLLLFPVYSQMLPLAAHTNAAWLWFFPPVWFTGMYDLFLPHSDPIFASLGRFALQSLAAVMALFCLTWALGFRRHYRRTLESEGTEPRPPRASLIARLPAAPEERAIIRFTGAILIRSTPHRLFLATWWSVGISIGLLTTIMVRNGQVGASPGGLRAVPFLIVFFVVSGFRSSFQFPAELASNWLFRITESGWTETARRAARKRVVASGLVPALLLFLPFETIHWGLAPGVFHTVFQFASGALLIELFFWSFRKVPFTCSYFPGKINLVVLIGLMVYGFTLYSFQMADLEATLDSHPLRAALAIATIAGALAWLWRRNPRATEVTFEAWEPEIQTLNLS
jgi:hypothetical protein